MTESDGETEADLTPRPRTRYNHAKCLALALLMVTTYACKPPLVLAIRDISEITGLNHHSLQTLLKKWVTWRLIKAYRHPIRGMNVYELLPKGKNLLDIQQEGFPKINSLGKMTFYQVDVEPMIRQMTARLEGWARGRSCSYRLLKKSSLKPGSRDG